MNEWLKNADHQCKSTHSCLHILFSSDMLLACHMLVNEVKRNARFSRVTYSKPEISIWNGMESKTVCIGIKVGSDSSDDDIIHLERSIEQNYLRCHLKWYSYEHFHRHCSRRGASQHAVLACPSCLCLAADMLTPASSIPPYHYQPCLLHQDINTPPAPSKYPTQTWSQRHSVVYVSICSQTLLLSDFVFLHLLHLPLQVWRHRCLATVSLLWTKPPISNYTAVYCLS